MSKVNFNEIFDIFEKHKNELSEYTLTLSPTAENYDGILNNALSYSHSKLRSDLIQYLESQKIEVE